jgi:hypothetical protein
MNVSVTSAPARTDARTSTGSGTSGPDLRSLRNRGLALTAGAVTWSAASFVYGFNPDTEAGVKVTDLTALAFQLGVLSLVGLQLRTRATGVTRRAAAMLKVERVLLTLAMAWSVLHALLPSQRGEVWLGVLDVFWPLSMLGMFVIGVKIAAAGRWRGAARLWPVVAESWAVVSIPAMAVFGASVGDVVGASHLLVGYATLGLIIAARPVLVADQS